MKRNSNSIEEEQKVRVKKIKLDEQAKHDNLSDEDEPMEVEEVLSKSPKKQPKGKKLSKKSPSKSPFQRSKGISYNKFFSKFQGQCGF